MKPIQVKHASQGNLKDISIDIPRNQLVVFTGISGSGKSTLLLDVLYMECQRQYLEAIGMQGIAKPKVEQVLNVSPAIVIAQKAANKNPRSSVGTSTNIYTDLRMIFEKLHERECPYCHETIKASECYEFTEKIEDDFKVYMDCPKCGKRMDKLTRSHFSFNTKEGACLTCQGIGSIMTLDMEQLLDKNKTLKEGAVSFWKHRYLDYQLEQISKAFAYYGIIFQDKKVCEFNETEMEILLNGTASVKLAETKKAPKTTSEGKFEGIVSTMQRRLEEKQGNMNNDIFKPGECPACHGEKLNQLSAHVKVNGMRLPEISKMTLTEIYEWLIKLEDSLSDVEKQQSLLYINDLKTKLNRIMQLGLGYLTLDRKASTLSKGEAQRIHLSAALDSTLNGVIYILDEPSIGLHSADNEGIVAILKQLRDLGNSVLVIEHDPSIIKEADYVIDIGPLSGKRGGEIVAKGCVDEIMHQPFSLTGKYLNEAYQRKKFEHKGDGNSIKIYQACQHNLKNINVTIPCQQLVTVTGVSGSGKSTLIFDVLAKQEGCEKVEGLELFDDIISVEQSPLTRMKRSNVATYTELYTEIRKCFEKCEQAKNLNLTARHFSFNSPGGRCETCEGLGYVVSNMLFFENQEVSCPTCHGKQFNEEVLSVKYQNYNIHEVLQLSIDEAAEVFVSSKKAMKIMTMLQKVGLGYLTLGQSLTTLSNGEAQRLKLATDLLKNKGRKTLYLLDEPTSGLHPYDVENFINLLHIMVEEGNSVIVIEHNEQLILASDWMIDLGEKGGVDGGNIIACGRVEDIMNSPKSLTGKMLRKIMGE